MTYKSVMDFANESKLVIFVQSRELDIKLLFSTATATLSRSLSYPVTTLTMNYLARFKFGQKWECYATVSVVENVIR